MVWESPVFGFGFALHTTLNLLAKILLENSDFTRNLFAKISCGAYHQ
jgi:hypothetical protein